MYSVTGKADVSAKNSHGILRKTMWWSCSGLMGPCLKCQVFFWWGHILSAMSVNRVHLKQNNGYVKDTISAKATYCFIREKLLQKLKILYQKNVGASL